MNPGSKTGSMEILKSNVTLNHGLISYYGYLPFYRPLSDGLL